AEEVSSEPEFAVVDESTAVAPVEAAPAGEEIDLSSEWDDAITIESDDTPAAAVDQPAAVEPAAPQPILAEESDPRCDEPVEEIRSYVGKGMPEQALAALAKLQTLTQDQAKIDELRAEVDAATQPAEEMAVEAEPAVEELTADDIPSAETLEEVSVAVEPEPVEEPEPTVEAIPV